MRIPIILAAAIVLPPTPGLSEILYARPDAEVAGAQYRWGNDVVPGAMPLKAALAIAGSVNGTRALEIRLLHASGAQETLYSVDLGSLQTASRWQGSENAKLVIRGQLEGSAAQRRALATVVPYRIAGFRHDPHHRGRPPARKAGCSTPVRLDHQRK